MGKGSWGGVIVRALIYGACMGCLITAGGMLVAAVVFMGGSGIGAGLVASPAFGVAGAISGLLCMIVPGLILATGRGYFRQHLRHARLVAACAGGVPIATFELLANGGNPAGYGSWEWESIALVLVAGAAVGAMGAGYVATGRKCVVARRVLRLK
jgi:hypothetical protein